MPSLEDATLQKWRAAFSSALQKRITPEQLKPPFAELKRTHPFTGKGIAALLVSFRAPTPAADDPLLFRYTRSLVTDNFVDTADILLALLDSTTLFSSQPDHIQDTCRHGLPSCEERFFLLLADLHILTDTRITVAQLHNTVLAVIRWIHAVCDHEYSRQLGNAGLHIPRHDTASTYEALASLVITVLGRASFWPISRQSWWEKRRTTVVREMQNFDREVLQPMQSQFGGRLIAMTLVPPFVDMDADGHPVVNPEIVLQLLTQDITITHAPSRAGLYVWLNACLFAQPMMEDSAVLSYLQIRFPGDNQLLVVHFLHAAFDVLTNVLVRGERPQDVFVVQSFICNKLPSLLATLVEITKATEPGIVEACIQSSFTAIAMDPIPPISAGSSQVTDVLRRARLEFLHACLMHGVVTEATITTVTQERLAARPKTVKYTREGLLNQCTNNVSRLEPLVRELHSMNGNAGAVSLCIVQTIGNLCAGKDTMALKTVCSILVKSVADVDIILQYTSARVLLLPLCNVLKDWVHDQDQGEFTPAYEEFAAIFLFTLAVLHRYDLDVKELGFAADEDISQILGVGFLGTASSELNDEQVQQLGKWLDGLFATDDQGEIGGIGDEVMRRCPPQTFYSLVPVLLEQSVLACKLGQLSLNTFQGGLELLLEPFLLPSLVVGLLWIARHSWEDHGDVEVLLQVLDKLLKPSSSAPETLAMHKAVVDIVAEPLQRSLEDLLRKRPEKAAVVNSMVVILRQHSNVTRFGMSSKTECDQWSSHKHGIRGQLQAILREMTVWAAATTPTLPPRYTHRILQAGVTTVGVDNILQTILAEIHATVFPSTAIALDIGTSMLSAPSTASGALRRELLMRVTDTAALLNMSAARAIGLVQLSHSVEAQLTVHQINMPITLPVSQSTDQMMQELVDASTGINAQTVGSGTDAAQLTVADIESAIGQGMSLNPSIPGMPGLEPVNLQDGQTLDFFGDINVDMDMNLMQQQVANQMPMQGSVTGILDETNPEDDIFADLDMGNGMSDLDFGFS
ncbi:hypothetical protein LTR62_000567 [Meristemomyces frigidus]|uniref:Mediator of RNA polymerase II transcription subunit 5 n=1 Tax=Meristemomyces frigidus TaxID=1508187 RepID=A0AAN7T961_9PEZI|nr:hypothetical protein LTR62_000567 [Meristemomyces frigidus]